MVVKIRTGKSVAGALYYNEKKVTAGVASLLMATRFGCDADELSVQQKVTRFQLLTALNKKVKTNALHISLNFSTNEKLNRETLMYIAADYMQQIGFSQQPFIVYEHFDAAHQHIHIVTTNITSEGKPINLHNLAKRLSEPARKEIEKKYQLIIAEGRRLSTELPFTPAISPVVYGRVQTKAAISNIVREVIATYQFTSLEELNAVLRQFNVVADRGQVWSRCYTGRGLIYSLLDKNGMKIGVPIPSSSIYTRPGLSYIEKKAAINKITGIYKRNRIKKLLDYAIKLPPGKCLQYLNHQKISCIPVLGTHGEATDLFLIDNFNRAVFSTKNHGYDFALLSQSLSNSNTQKNTQLYTAPELNPLLLAASSLLSSLTYENPNDDLISPELLRKKKRKKGKL